MANGQLRITGGRKVKSPKGIEARPTTSLVRTALMNILARKIENCYWLDLCSGSGIMSCEALQKGAEIVVAIEKDKKTFDTCKSNIFLINEGIQDKAHTEIIHQDAIAWLRKRTFSKNLIEAFKGHSPGFDIVYLDPPYTANLYEPILKLLIERFWLRKDAIVICEHSTKTPLQPSPEWIEQDRRSYGSTALLFISPLKECSVDTGSKQLQKAQEL